MTTPPGPPPSTPPAPSADALIVAVSGLPVRDVDALRAASLQAAARAAFVRARDRKRGSVGWGLYRRALEPVLVTGLCAGYLLWAVAVVTDLRRPLAAAGPGSGEQAQLGLHAVRARP